MVILLDNLRRNGAQGESLIYFAHERAHDLITKRAHGRVQETLWSVKSVHTRSISLWQIICES